MTRKRNPKRPKKRNHNRAIQKNQGGSSPVPTQPSKQPQGSTSQIIERQEHHLFVGPLPPPETLERYNNILPDGAERIMAMAEKQSLHRQQLEKQALGADFDDARRQRKETRIGQILGFLVVICALIACVIIIISVPGAGGAVPGSIIGGGGLIGLVYAFRYGKSIKAETPDEQ